VESDESSALLGRGYTLRETASQDDGRRESSEGLSYVSSAVAVPEMDGDNRCTDDEESTDSQSRLVRTAMICFIFMVVEIIGGVTANSLAILTDAAHMMSDVSSMAIAISAMRLATLPATTNYTFGFHKAEVLGALLGVQLIWVLTAVLVYQAVLRLIDPHEVDGEIMLLTAGFGLLTNISMLTVLGEHGHSHGMGEACDHGENINVAAARMHIIGDLLQTLGVFLAACLIWWQPADIGCRDVEGDCISNWMMADPICTLAFAVLVMWTTKQVFSASIKNLMMRAPAGLDIAAMEGQLNAISGVMEVSHVHSWEATVGRKWCVSARITIDAFSEHEQVLLEARQICTNLGIWDSTIEIEQSLMCQPIGSAPSASSQVKVANPWEAQECAPACGEVGGCTHNHPFTFGRR